MKGIERHWLQDNRKTLKDIKEEIRLCFEENPDLILKKLEDIAEFFYLQGYLYQSNIVEAYQNKFIHFQKHLSKERLERAQESWDASGI